MLVSLVHGTSPNRDAALALMNGGRIAGPPTSYGFRDTRDLTPFGRVTLGAAMTRPARLSSPVLATDAGPVTYVGTHCAGKPEFQNCGDTVRHSPHVWFDCR